MCIMVAEAKLNKGSIQEAESALREGLLLNFEEARALLGKLEYQRGNVEGALQVFDGIDLQAAIQRMQPLANKPPSKKGRLNLILLMLSHSMLPALCLKLYI